MAERAGRGFEEEFAAGPQQKERLAMAVIHGSVNDHDRRKAAIVRLTTKIGLALCQSEFRHVGENEWLRLERLRVELGALRAEAGL